MPKYMSVITIYSDFDPAQVELSTLAREAEEGSAAICTDYRSTEVRDTDLPEQASEFFQL